MSNQKQENIMKLALIEARKAYEVNEVPVGAIITIGNEIISTGYNQPISSNDSTCHAEIVSIRKASNKIGNYRLIDTTLYTTLEPCAMCYGAIVHARISRIVFGAYDLKSGVCGSAIKLHEKNIFNHKPKVIGGVLEKECSLLLKDFFKERRN